MHYLPTHLVHSSMPINLDKFMHIILTRWKRFFLKKFIFNSFWNGFKFSLVNFKRGVHGLVKAALAKRLWSDLRRTSDVLGVLDFQIACLRPETPALYPRSLLTHHEEYGQKLRHPRRFRGREREFQRSGTARTSTYWGAWLWFTYEVLKSFDKEHFRWSGRISWESF